MERKELQGVVLCLCVLGEESDKGEMDVEEH